MTYRIHAGVRAGLLALSLFSGMTVAAEPGTLKNVQDDSLTQAQRSRIIALHADAQQCLNAINKEKPIEAEKDKAQMVREGKVDKQRLATAQKTVHTAEDEAVSCRLNYYAAVSTILTPAQKANFMAQFER